jgi:predicted nuclease of predicted toxin-antitoxin system
VKLLLDEMLSAVIAEQLRIRNHDVAAVDERSDLRGVADIELFERAQLEERSIVTYDRDDFLALDRRYRDGGRDHHGIVILSTRRFPQGASIVGAIVASLDALLTAGPPYPSFVHWLQ